MERPNPHSPEHGALPKPTVEYQALIDNEEIRRFALTVTRPDGASMALLPITQKTDRRNDDKLLASSLREQGTVPMVLPAHGDRYTETEKQFAHTILGADHTELIHSLRPHMEAGQVKQEVLFFEPTTQSILDLMRFSGHDTDKVRQARYAAANGEPNGLADAVGILLEVARARSESHDRPMTARERGLMQAFGLKRSGATYELDLVEKLCRAGSDSWDIEAVQRRLAVGVDPSIISEVSSGDAEVKDMVSNLWQEALELSEQNNNDPLGIYTELHRIGDQFIPIPALVSMAYTGGGGLGEVHEGSGHNLAQIYRDSFTHPRANNEQADDLVRSTKLLQLSLKLGIGDNTLVARGRWRRDTQGKSAYYVRQDAFNSSNGKPNDDLIAGIADLSEMGVPMAIVSKDETQTVEYEKTGDLLGVTTDFEYVSLPQYKQSQIKGSPEYGVLTGFDMSERYQIDSSKAGETSIVEGKHLKIYMAYGRGRMHSDIYDVTGQTDTKLKPIRLGGEDIINMGIRYSTRDQVTGRNPVLELILESPLDAVKQSAYALKQIIDKVKDDASDIFRNDEQLNPTEVVIFHTTDKDSVMRSIKFDEL